MIVAFSGLAGSGKDTSADFLVAHNGFVKVAFADPMKRVCASVFPKMTREHLWGPSSKRNEPILEYPREHGPWVTEKLGGTKRCACCNVEWKYYDQSKCYLTARFALQQLGTEWGRLCYENTWAELAIDVANSLLFKSGILRSVHYSYTPWDGLMATNTPVGPKVRGVVISDLRWPDGNEGKIVQSSGGKLLKLKRGEGLSGAIGAHESEKAMSGVPESVFDFIIDNREWSLDQLRDHLQHLATEHLTKRKKA